MPLLSVTFTIAPAVWPSRGVEAGRRDLELLHRAGGRHERHAPAVGHVGRAVERELVAAGGAVGIDRRRAGVVERTRELQIAGERDAGHQPRQHERIAVRERHQRDPLLVDHLAGRGRAEIEQRRRAVTDDRFFDAADLETLVERQAIADADLDAAGAPAS